MPTGKSFGQNQKTLSPRRVPWFLVVFTALVLVALAQNGEEYFAQLSGQEFCYSYENGACASRGKWNSCRAAGLLTAAECQQRMSGMQPSMTQSEEQLCGGTDPDMCNGSCPEGTACGFSQLSGGKCVCQAVAPPPPLPPPPPPVRYCYACTPLCTPTEIIMQNGTCQQDILQYDKVYSNPYCDLDCSIPIEPPIEVEPMQDCFSCRNNQCVSVGQMEVCDPFMTTDECNESCVGPVCGNGLQENGEECDDGNTISGDGCDAACKYEPSECGNPTAWQCNGTCPGGKSCLYHSFYQSCRCLTSRCGNNNIDIDLREKCDDGNNVDGDGCSSTCTIETGGCGAERYGQVCSGNCPLGQSCVKSRWGWCDCTTCGNGVVDAPFEECDDGNQIDEDACTNACNTPRCGDDVIQPGEECDNGGINSDKPWQSGPRCDTSCRYHPNRGCGDGVVDDFEDCDDGNSIYGDGCDFCKLSTASAGSCGNGTVESGEECDEGLHNGDESYGCTTSCRWLLVGGSDIPVDMPPLPVGPISGECRAETVAYFCSSALDQANATITDCMDTAEVACSDRGGSFIRGTPNLIQTATFFSCTVSGSATWECLAYE